MEEGKLTFNCIQTHVTVQFGKSGGGDVGVGGYKKRTTKTRSVCGPWNPVVWYTAPLKLTVVFIVALEISLVKLQAWPVNQGCLSLPAAHSPAQNPRLRRSHEDLAGSDEAGNRLCERVGLVERGGGGVVWGHSCLCKSHCVYVCVSPKMSICMCV